MLTRARLRDRVLTQDRYAPVLLLAQKLSPSLENGARDWFKAGFAQRGITPTEAELQGVMSVAKHESSFGRGWKPGSPMEGSFNMGAVQCCKANEDGSCPPGSALQGDTHPDGTKYTVCFRTYPSPDAGAADLVRILYQRKGVPEALKAGDLHALASAMFATNYFEGTCQKGDPPGTGTGKEKFCAASGRIDRYAGALFTAAKDSAAVTGVPLAVVQKASGVSGGTGVALLVIGTLAVGGYLVGRYKRAS